MNPTYGQMLKSINKHDGNFSNYSRYSGESARVLFLSERLNAKGNFQLLATANDYIKKHAIPIVIDSLKMSAIIKISGTSWSDARASAAEKLLENKDFTKAAFAQKALQFLTIDCKMSRNAIAEEAKVSRNGILKMLGGEYQTCRVETYNKILACAQKYGYVE